MAKRHLKRMAAPRTWPIERKKTTFIYRPYPGAHSMHESISIGTVLKEILHLAKTNREARKILYSKQVLVDGKRRKDEHDSIGLFDVLELPDANSRFRIIINQKGKIDTLSIDKNEAGSKPVRIVKKTLFKGKIQLNLSDGRNILADKDSYKTGDTLIIEVPSQQIKKHLKLEKKSVIFLTGGKYLGHMGIVEGISGERLMYKTEDGVTQETRKDYAFVVGEGKPALSVFKK